MPVVPGTQLNTVTVTGTFKFDDGSPGKGKVVFTRPAIRLVDPAQNQIIYPLQVTANLDPSTGSFSVALLVTNDPDYTVTPSDGSSGWLWTVSEQIQGQNPYTYQVEVPLNTPGGTVDLADMPQAAPVSSVGSNTYVLVSQVGTSVPRLSGGTVPLDELGTGTPGAGKYVDGGTGAWTNLPAPGGANASNIAVTPAGGIQSTDVEDALYELDTEKATSASLTAHLNDTIDAHDASATSFIPTSPLGTITATDVQTAATQLDALKLARLNGYVYVDCNGDASTARPTGVAGVVWDDCPTQPTNMQPQDIWLPPPNTDIRPLYGPELRRWYADLNMAANQAVNVLMVGDSVTQGSTADPIPGTSFTLGPGRYIETFLRRMQNAKGTGRGTIFKPTVTLFDNGTAGIEWTHSGSITYVGTSIFTGPPGGPGPNAGGLGLHAVNIGASTSNYIEATQDCDSFQVWYKQTSSGTGAFQVLVDGQTVATVTPATGTAWGQIWDSVTAGVKIAPGKHTVRVKCSVTGTNGPIIEGGIFFNGDYGTGVHVYHCAHGGFASTHIAANTNWAQSAGKATPSLVVYNMGLNDLTLGTAIATFKTNVNTALDAVRTAMSASFVPSELILIPHAHAYNDATYPTEHPESDWQPYRLALYEVAQARGAAVLDMNHLFGYAKATSDTADLFNDTDEIHLNERGHRAMGNLLADYLMGDGRADRGDPDGIMALEAEPPAPAAGAGTRFLVSHATRPMLMVKPAVGHPVAPFPYTKLWSSQQASATGLAWVGYNGPDATVPTGSTVTVTGPNALALAGINYATGTTANQTAGAGDAMTGWWRGAGPHSSSAGFFFAGAFSLGGTITNMRVFIGFTSQTTLATAVGAADPGVEHCGFTYQSGTANWQFTTRDGTTRSQVDTGMLAEANSGMEFYIWCPAGSASMYWQVRNINATDSTAVANRQLSFGDVKTTNLPTAVMKRAWYVATTDTTSKSLKMTRLYTETDR